MLQKTFIEKHICVFRQSSSFEGRSDMNSFYKYKKRHYRFAFVLFLILFIAIPCKGNAKNITVEATGEYTVIDSIESIDLCKNRAKVNAMRTAAEKAGVYVESYSKVDNMILTADEVRVVAAKVLKIEECKIIPITEGEQLKFVCNIKALVDTNDIDLVSIMKNKVAIEKCIAQEKNIMRLQNEIDNLRKKYHTATESNQKVEIKNEIQNNERKFKALLVQVSDLNLSEFHNDMVEQNALLKTNITLGGIKNIEVLNKRYDTYILLANDNAKNGKCVLSFFTNKNRAISKITISAPLNERYSVNCAFKMEHVVLCALGVSDLLAQNFLVDLRNRSTPCGQAVWADWSNRNLVVEHLPSVKDGLYYIRIYAVNREFL